MTRPRKKLVFAPTMVALEVWARPRGLGPCDVVHVLADPRHRLRGRVVEPDDLVHLEGASAHPNYKEAMRLLPPGVEMPEPVSPLAFIECDARSPTGHALRRVIASTWQRTSCPRCGREGWAFALEGR